MALLFQRAGRLSGVRCWMTRAGAVLLTTLFALGSSSSGRVQTLPPRLMFEVASIRPSKPGGVGGFIKPLPGGIGYTSQNIPIKLIFSLMYRVPMRQISGGPEWLGSEPYDIEARADRPYPADDLREMFRNLLADRFNLKFHKDTKQGNVYALSVDRSGLKMKLNGSAENFDIPITFGPDGTALGKRVPVPYLCWFLGGRLPRDERPVIAATGLDKPGRCSAFTLSYAPARPPDVPRDGPSLFEALKQQLGLTLTPQKGPVEYYVIDHVERPSEN